MIHKAYLQSTDKLRTAFRSAKVLPSLTLLDILSPSAYQQVCRQLPLLSFIREEKSLSHSYGEAVPSPSLNSVLTSAELYDFISAITGRKVGSISWKIYSLTWKDYTLLHDQHREKAGVDIILDCSAEWPAPAGGQIMYTDGRGNVFSIPVRANALTIVYRSRRIQRYIQYCNHYARNKKRYLIVGKVQ